VDKGRSFIPSTAGASALIWILDLSSRLARDLTSPTTPNLDVAYSGAMGRGYSPALEAVTMMEPREGAGVSVGLRFM